MKPKEHIGSGSLARVGRTLEDLSPRRVFLVTGKHSFAASGAGKFLEGILSRYDSRRFSDFSKNVKFEEVMTGLEALRLHGSDCILVVGGGSAIDTAKLIRHFHSMGRPPTSTELCSEDWKRASPAVRSPIPLVAVPTTSGSGSEATHFAVLYVGHMKRSVADLAMLPDVAIVDPDLTFSLPPRDTAVTGMDALSQAVESFWSIRSTEESRAYAREAIVRILASLRPAVSDPDPGSRAEMSKAAHYAGKAINITKTTAAHAISYPLTSLFGIPHGHAVSLTLGSMLIYNAEVTDIDVADPRGSTFLRNRIAELCGLFSCRDPLGARRVIESLMLSIGLETSLAAVGVGSTHIKSIVDHVDPERLGNNPRTVTRETLEGILGALCEAGSTGDRR